MSVQLAYVGVILIWATTPLAIKWSTLEVSFLFGVMSRMVIGAAICWALLFVLRIPMPWHRDARRTYGAAALGIFGSMLLTYWGAQFIASGLISVLFGVTPLATGLMAAAWLGERSLSPVRVLGIGLGLAGLTAIFGAGAHMDSGAWRGIAAVLLAALLHSASGVWVKRIGSDMHPVALNCGALAIAVPLYLLMWWVFDGVLPTSLSTRTLFSIGYLGVFGTALGFVLYFFILKHLTAGVISLITLITPVLALFAGRWLNDETIPAMVWTGTGFILAGLLLYQWGPRLWLARAGQKA